jgi:hypothetical protein
MRKSKDASDAGERLYPPQDDMQEDPAPAADDECCALLRPDPVATPAPVPRRHRMHGNHEDKRC